MVVFREEPVTVELSGDEALVLFEWLSSHVMPDSFDDFDDQAEERALWILHGHLERSVAAPLRRDYDLILSDARERLRDPTD